jgi:hypothetical protein
MTLVQMERGLAHSGKKLSRQGLHYHLRALKIRPKGIGRPAIYPDTALKKIMDRLGIDAVANGHDDGKRGRKK